MDMYDLLGCAAVELSELSIIPTEQKKYTEVGSV